jgi:hypothetical protein
MEICKGSTTVQPNRGRLVGWLGAEHRVCGWRDDGWCFMGRAAANAVTMDAGHEVSSEPEGRERHHVDTHRGHAGADEEPQAAPGVRRGGGLRGGAGAAKRAHPRRCVLSRQRPGFRVVTDEP